MKRTSIVTQGDPAWDQFAWENPWHLYCEEDVIFDDRFEDNN